VTIHAVVPVHNRVDFTRQFLTSVRAQECSEDIHIVVVDDGSTDGTAEFLALQSEITVFNGDGKLWWAGAIALATRLLKAQMKPGDFLYLGNNDTILDPGHIQALLNVSGELAVVGSVAVEIWPDGTRNPVSSGFMIDTEELDVRNAGLDRDSDLDALAGRGMLIPVQAVPFLRFHPHLMPQHFADLSFTAQLKRQGFPLAVALNATSTQLERAGSSVEFTPLLTDAFSKRSQIYVPALWTFWWLMSSPAQRITLPARFIARGVRQWSRGAYA
jgi:N-acetylglucosaminyl-diphospho-decaprenol L-rhamnosyltransferase